MKKIILLIGTMLLCGISFGGTQMRILEKDGNETTYAVDEVEEVEFVELSADEVEQGVSVTGKEGGYTYVDLGLKSGTMWATFNLGATKPEGYGNYYAWGEVSTKDNYTAATYIWEDYVFNEPTNYTKYCTTSTYGTVDNLTILESTDDAATYNWGKAWRMPTAVEQEELVKGCTWQWTNDFKGTGIAGRIGTSVANGNTIFLPAGGYCSYSKAVYVGTEGYYWSSQLRHDISLYAHFIQFSSEFCRNGYDERHLGKNIRAVLVNQK